MDASHSTTGTLKVFHVDGAGARPDGTGSGFAWVRIGTEKQRVKRVDGLTNNEAEYRALLAVLKYLAEGSRARIFTDSQLVCEQFNGRWAVNDPKLIDLLSRARDLIENKSLHVEVAWIPRGQNEAGKLLERKGRAHLVLRGSSITVHPEHGKTRN
jgi:ribonuclease HI